MLTKNGTVHYRKHVSDVELQLILKRTADALGTVITVHSGDRDFRPKGSPAKSLHLPHRAADIHAAGISDSALFQKLLDGRAEIFKSVVHRYEVIHHGKFTATEGEHVHIGDYHFIKADTDGAGIVFKEEGIAPTTKGRYTVVCKEDLGS